MRLSILFILLAFWATAAQAQEKVVPLAGNPALKSLIQSGGLKNQMVADTLSLPFIDDFSSYSGFPHSSKWADQHAFVNPAAGFAPPSLGVATLDAIDSIGSLYAIASSSAFLADALTSHPIRLGNLSPADSVYLSFFYQAGGWADVPEESDSLVVEFFNPGTNQWARIWAIPGQDRAPFRPAMIPITDPQFFSDSFRFRFRNYASLTGLFEPSWAGNCDQWNLDYIYLNSQRTASDTVMPDLAFTLQSHSLLSNYERMPWTHFIANSSEMGSKFTIHFRNNDEVSRTTYLDFKFFEPGTTDTFSIDGGAFNLFPAFTDTSLSYNHSYVFQSNQLQEAEFRARCFFRYTGAANDLIQENDTMDYRQVFRDYYAYDDGSPENGYGLSGEGTQNAKVAVLFHNYKTDDTLRAIQMYFNQTDDNASQDYFYLSIWSDKFEGGVHEPDTLIFRRIGYRPEYEDSLNRFHTYLLDTAMAMPEYFFVGWGQTTNDLLNLGLDVNRIQKPTDNPSWRNPVLFYNLSGQWQQSAFGGAPMIRTVFSPQALVANPKTPVINPIMVYPNPAKGHIFINLPEGIGPKAQWALFDPMGRVCLSGIPDSSPIDLKALSPGLYYLRLSDGQHVFPATRLIVARP